MPAYEHGRASQHRAAVQRSTRSAAPQPPILALQRAAGNAAVTRTVELQRMADEQSHEHGAACGHDLPVQRSSVLDVINTPGAPVESAVRAKAEIGLGTDLGDVVKHTGPAARQSAAELGAHAYTVGRHIVVGEGGESEHVMLHELAHTWQNGAASTAPAPAAHTADSGAVSVTERNAPTEVQAEDLAHELKNVSVPAQGAAARGADAQPDEA